MAIPGVRPRFLAPGDRLGKFDLIRQIAVGGMAELYLARTMGIEGFEKLVVVKRILPQYANNATYVNMFLNEARLSATLHHPNIAQVYDIGVEEGDYFFSMEYLHGEDLGRLHTTSIENGVPMSLDAALTLVAGLCAGLHYAHAKAGPDGKPLGVVHRDVSPSNVLVTYDGGVKLVDFGIARAGNTPGTTRGGLKGKIQYMSPEQCRGDAVLDRRSDIFSTGTILYELTTGRLPFIDENEYAMLSNIVHNDVPRPSSIVPSYAPALEAIVLKALARDPAQRYATALELQKELEDFAHETRLRVSPLVLARLMSTLFPARLEEWDQARAQGAFFVEQHVLRTLVESGKSDEMPAVTAADNEATDIVMALPAPKRARADRAEADNAPADEPFAPENDVATIADNPFVDARTLPGHAPMRQRASSPRPALRAPTPPTATPVPAHIVAAAIAPEVPAFNASHPGVLISNPAPHADGDRARRDRNDETAFVRIDRKSRAPLYIAITVLLAGAAVAAFIAFGGSTTVPADAPTPTVTNPVLPTDRAAVVLPAEPATAPILDAAVPDEPDEIDEIEPRTKLPPTAEAKRVKKKPALKRVAKKTVEKPAKKPEAKLAPKPEPNKETEWNADSPFMPVRQ